MSNAEELYECLVEPDGLSSETVTCSVCGSAPALWQYKEKGGSFSKVVMCVNGESVIDPNDVLDDGCVMYMPPMNFYKATRREAIKHWNLWHTAMREQRQARSVL